MKPDPLKSGDGWEEEYGIKRLREKTVGEVDPVLQVCLFSLDTFLNVKIPS